MSTPYLLPGGTARADFEDEVLATADCSTVPWTAARTPSGRTSRVVEEAIGAEAAGAAVAGSGIVAATETIDAVTTAVAERIAHRVRPRGRTRPSSQVEMGLYNRLDGWLNRWLNGWLNGGAAWLDGGDACRAAEVRRGALTAARRRCEPDMT